VHKDNAPFLALEAVASIAKVAPTGSRAGAKCRTQPLPAPVEQVRLQPFNEAADVSSCWEPLLSAYYSDCLRSVEPRLWFCAVRPTHGPPGTVRPTAPVSATLRTATQGANLVISGDTGYDPGLVKYYEARTW